jgi:hypothetical protein
VTVHRLALGRETDPLLRGLVRLLFWHLNRFPWVSLPIKTGYSFLSGHVD